MHPTASRKPKESLDPWAPSTHDPKQHFATANYRIAKGSFDHLVGAELNRRRQVDADCLGGFEVDDQLEFCGLLNGEIGGFRPVEDFGHVKADLTKIGYRVYAVGDKSTGLRVGSLPLTRRDRRRQLVPQTVLRRRRYVDAISDTRAAKLTNTCLSLRGGRPWFPASDQKEECSCALYTKTDDITY